MPAGGSLGQEEDTSQRNDQQILENIEDLEGGQLLLRLGEGGLVKLISSIVEQEVSGHWGRSQ